MVGWQRYRIRGPLEPRRKRHHMSRSVDVEISFERLPSLIKLLRTMQENDIEPLWDGLVWATSNGDYDWERSDPRECLTLLLEMTRTLRRNEDVGLGVTWRSTERRGTLLLMPHSHRLSFSPDFETLTYSAEAGSTGLGWYVDALSAAFASLNPTGIIARDLP
jgi:hypothetical protein